MEYKKLLYQGFIALGQGAAAQKELSEIKYLMFPFMVAENEKTDEMRSRIIEEEANFAFNIKRDGEGGFSATQERLK